MYMHLYKMLCIVEKVICIFEVSFRQYIIHVVLLRKCLLIHIVVLG